MSKVSIKKNVKPKKVAPKKKITPKKVTPNKKEGQTQTQSVIVNVGSQGKKSITRSKKQQSTKKPIQQPISQPSITSYNQPIFKQPSQQPSSLVSSILATQEKPNIVAKENKEESALTRALIQQNTELDQPETNDLERVRAKRVEKLEPPITINDGSILQPPITINDGSILQPITQPPLFFPSFKKINKESRDKESVKYGLLGQLIDEKGDDTEEIKGIIASSLTGGLFRPTPTIPNPLRIIYDYTPSLSNPLRKESKTIAPNPLTNISQPEETKEESILQETKTDDGPDEFFDPVQPDEIISENYNDIGSVIDDMLSSGPSSVLNKEDEIVSPLNLQPIQQPEPSILQPSAATSSLTESLKGQAEDKQPQAIQTLQAEEATPILEAEKVISSELSGYDEAFSLFKQLKLEGKIDKSVKQDKSSDTAKSGKIKKGVEDYTNDINQVPGYEDWKPRTKPAGRPRKEVSILTSAEIQPTLLQSVKSSKPLLPQSEQSVSGYDYYEK